jgi:hypothetical protein
MNIETMSAGDKRNTQPCPIAIKAFKMPGHGVEGG